MMPLSLANVLTDLFAYVRYLLQLGNVVILAYVENDTGLG